MSYIPLSFKKQAGILDAVPEFLWHHDQGPLENIFTWLERFMVVFSGGTMSLVMIALMAAGYSLADIGRYLDNMFGLRNVSDLKGVNPSSLTEKATDFIMGKIGGLGDLATSGSIPLTQILIKNAVDTPADVEDILRGLSDDGGEVSPSLKYRMEEDNRKRQERADVRTQSRQDRTDALEREKAELARKDLSDAEKRKHESAIRELERTQELEDRAYKDEQLQKDRGYREQQENAERARKDEQVQKDRAYQSEKQTTEQARQKEEMIQQRQYEEKSEMRRFKAQQKLTGMKMPGGKSFFSGAGKAALGIGLTGLIGYIFRSITDPSSWLARALRGVGLYEAGKISGPGTSDQRQRQEQPGQTGQSSAPASDDYKANLEQAFDNILGH